MVYYKSYRIVDGKPRWVIEDENGNIVDRNPYKEELKGLEKFPEKDGRSNPRLKISDNELLEYLRQFEKENGRIPVVCEFNENPKYPNGDIYFKRFGSWNNALNLAGIIHREKLYGVLKKEPKLIVDLSKIIIYEDDHVDIRCCKCGKSETYMRRYGPEWIKYKDERRIWDKKSYMCKKCYSSDYQNRPDSQNNIRRSLANCRNGNLSKNSETGIGLIGEAVIAKVRGLKIINIELDNFHSKIDLSYDNEFGTIQSKFSFSKFGIWEFSTGGIEYSDTVCLLCANRTHSTIRRVYMIPANINVSTITINDTINPRGSKWDKFRIGKGPYNNTYQNLVYSLNDKKFFGIEDIKKWLDGGI